MKIAGIIAEYNPFHKGHAYHIQKTRELTGADYVVSVISGDFVQRGGPAFLPRHFRAKMALLGGADLVFELPSTCSCQSAEFFARRGVELLDGLGCVNFLSFGSESGNLKVFRELGSFLGTETPLFQHHLQKELKSGLSYPAARQKALLACLPGKENIQKELESLLSSPNNILGIEYCKALFTLGSSIQPVTVLRKGSGYHEKKLHNEYPSASALRRAFTMDTSHTNQDFPEHLFSGFPSEVLDFLRSSSLQEYFVTEDDFSLLLRQMLYRTDPAAMAACQDMTPELLHRILNTRDQYENFSQYVSLLKTRELTYTRICRTLFHALLDIREVSPVPYARLLGFRRSAAPVLTAIKRQGTLPLLTKLADAPSRLSPRALEVLEQNITLSHLYESVLCEKNSHKFQNEYTKQMILL